MCIIPSHLPCLLAFDFLFSTLFSYNKYKRSISFYISVYGYSLVKMVYGFAVNAEQDNPVIRDLDLEQSIRRNFSGLDDLDPMEIFTTQFPSLGHSVKVTKCYIELHTGIYVQDVKRLSSNLKLYSYIRKMLLFVRNYICYEEL